ncbi:MAG: methyltransferase domain-containing protein, partial [Chloroflexi bacterium]|nr:methyltransferase domain-containing protein [Chloroflexota bacterium]
MQPASFSDLRTLRQCRSCGGNLVDFLGYDRVPVAGTYLSESDLDHEPLLPLTVALCEDCKLVQLREVLPDHVYRSYRFVGTGSAGYRAHLEWVAESLVARWGMRNRRILEIGCSDGYLLAQVRARGDNWVFGYEPSLHLRQACARANIPVSDAFFSARTVDRCPILPVDVVIVRHVLEHVDDLHDFLCGVTAALAPPGILVIEVPDIIATMRTGPYSQFYHEHLSYFGPTSLHRLLAQHGLHVLERTLVDVHGGSRYVVCSRANGLQAADAPPDEPDLDLSQASAFAARVQAYFRGLREFVEAQRLSGTRLAGYGAAQRTVVTCSLAGLTGEHI